MKIEGVVHLYFLEDHSLANYYGLTEDEVREKLNYFNFSHKHEEVKKYYNGYKTMTSGDNIYNTCLLYTSRCV